MGRKVGVAPLAALIAGSLFAVWTWLTLSTTALAGLDAWSLRPGVAAASPAGQVLAALAVISSPWVVYAVVAGFAYWAFRRRLSRLAWAMLASIVLAVAAVQLLKNLFARPRPPFVEHLITSPGFSYPSGHMTAATVAVVLIGSAQVVTRRRALYTRLTMVLLAVLWWIILADRFLLRAHYLTDLFGAGFLGVFVTSLALAVFRVHVNRLTPAGNGGVIRHVAVVFNPTKIPDLVMFRRQIQGECEQRGWQPPLWLETDAQDSGAAATRRARTADVDLALVAGGDGTVRTACAELAGSGIPVGVLPAGTGNLLARNLGVPLDMAEALDVAFDGRPRAIDLIEVRADDREPDHCLVMAGMGADALIMAETNDDLKKVVGSAAYVMAALQAVNRPPFELRVEVGDNEPVERRVGLAMVANVGAIQGQIRVAPDAEPDDGRLDVVIASLEGPLDWGPITTRILARAQDAEGVERAQAASVVFHTPAPVPYQIDGDAMGACTRLEARSLARVLEIMVPGHRR